MAISILHSEQPQEDLKVAGLRDRLRSGRLTAAGQGQLDVPSIVRGVIEDVSQRGDDALVDLAAKFDRVEMTPEEIAVPAERIEAAYAAADKEFLALARRVIANIRQYQEHIKLRAPQDLQRDGRRLGVRYTPVDRVGLYVPGGAAMYPSTVLMTVVPAQVAGVREIAIASPPTKDAVNDMVLALARELGITEIYRIGGSQAIAAMAIGTEHVRAVHKIAGPGNAFVAEAKKQLFGRVDIDSVAGPSEVLIVADDSARPEFVAADMLAQAEHNPGSAVLVTTSAALAQAVAEQIETQLAKLSRAQATRQALELYSGIIVVPSLQVACEVANDFATEHLQIITCDDKAALAMIRHAGAIFLGSQTPVPLGDYYAGPSHVLPTGGTARFFSALSVNSFLKASSVISYDAAGIAADAADVVDFATREGLTAHAAAVQVRHHN